MEARRLKMVLAAVEDADTVLDLLTEAAAWSRAQGIEGLWKVPYPREWLLPSLQRKEVYLAWWEGAVAGTLTFRWTDQPTWGARPDDAGYVHRLATRRSLSGQGVGARMLEWASLRCRNFGRSWLRLDCLSSHERLQRYYESLGFQRVGSAVVEGNHVLLFQRPVRGSWSFPTPTWPEPPRSALPERASTGNIK